MPTNKTLLCAVDEISENSSKSFHISKNDQEIALFITKRNNQLFAYRNHCPHTGAPLNWQPDRFMDREGEYIQCSIHGAKFEVETGRCVWGPCASQHLIEIVITIEDGCIYI